MSYENIGGANRPFIGARVSRSTALSHTSSGSEVLFNGLDTEEYDTDGCFDAATSTSKLFAPRDGYYLVYCGLNFAGNATGARQLRIRHNSDGSTSGGTSVALAATGNAGAANGVNLNAQAIIWMDAGDHVEVFGYQNSTGNLNMLMNTGLSFGLMYVGK